MYTSISETRISFALNRVFSTAAIEAHSAPPTAPPTTISGSSSGLVLPSKYNAMPPPAIAPTMYWPSAPMFQTLARKPTARPTAISISGVALSSSSATP